MSNQYKQNGFTLMELMITVAIIGILAAITIPSYTKYVQKTKRADAKVELMRIAQLQESYFVQNMSYAKKLTTGAGGLGLGATTVLSEQEQYTITMTATPAGCSGDNTTPCTAFDLSAVPKSGTSQANDTECKGFKLDNIGRKLAKGGATTTYTAAQGKKCWK